MTGYIKCCKIKLRYPCKVLQHLQRHLEPLKYKCTECSKVYLNDHELAKHVDARHKGQPKKEKTLPCAICQKLFTTKQSLHYHMRRHKNSENDEFEDVQFVKFIAENFDMKCDHCDTVFDGFYDARRHYRQHHNDKGYLKCCNMKLRELCRVRDHIKSHLDPECFKCDACGKSFSTGMMLAQHKRRHKMTLNKRFTTKYQFPKTTTHFQKKCYTIQIGFSGLFVIFVENYFEINMLSYVICLQITSIRSQNMSVMCAIKSKTFFMIFNFINYRSFHKNN